MELILEFIKKAIAALLEIFGIEVDTDFTDNVESALGDIVDFGNEAAK